MSSCAACFGAPQRGQPVAFLDIIEKQSGQGIKFGF
jgi:hypothetical protein